MGLHLGGRASGALDERLHRVDVLTNAMRRSLPMELHEDAVSDSACVDEDSPVREGCEQTAPVSDAERRVQCDRLPNSVDVAFGDSVTSEYGSGQIGAFDLETSLARRALTESKIVHDGGSEEEVLVVVGVIQTALTVGQQAGEEKAADAVIE